MSKPWHDINDPVYSHAVDTQAPRGQAVTDADQGAESQEKSEEPEVRLISAEWKPGPEGFQYNEPCFLEVTAEYLTKTNRTRLRGKLFGTYNGQEVDLKQEIEGHIDRETGIARMEIKRLWFVNDPYHDAWSDDKSAKSQYVVRALKHSKGANEIESPALEMPVSATAVFKFSIPIDPNDPDSQDDKIRMFSTDDAASYDTTLTVKDDTTEGNDTLELEFSGLDESLSFTLEVDPGGQGETYYIFEDKTLEELCDA